MKMKNLFKNLLLCFLFVFAATMVTSCLSSNAKELQKDTYGIKSMKYAVKPISLVEKDNQIGDSLPTDFSNSFCVSYKLPEDLNCKVYTIGDLDTQIYIYIDGALAYVEDDQINDEGDVDNNAMFIGSIKAGSHLVIIVTAATSGSTTIVYPIINK